MENNIRSFAITTARRITDGSSRDFEDTIQRIRLAKAQLASIMAVHEQTTRARTQLNSVGDEMQTTQEQDDAFTARLNKLKTKHTQFTNILHALRGEDSEADGDDEASPRGRKRSKTPYPRRHAGHVGAASPEREEPDTYLKAELKELQKHLKDLYEEGAKRDTDQTKAAGQWHRHTLDEHQAGLHDIKTAHEKQRRHQRREYDKHITVLRSELATASRKAPGQASGPSARVAELRSARRELWKGELEVSTL